VKKKLVNFDGFILGRLLSRKSVEERLGNGKATIHYPKGLFISASSRRRILETRANKLYE